MVHLVITLDGHLDAARLCQAMYLVMEAEPLLACRFVESSTPFWEKMPVLPRDSIFSLVKCEDSEAALQQVMTARLDPAEGPQARLTLLRGPKDRLVLSVNHTVSDACGVKHICLLLGQAYRSLEHDPHFSLPLPLLQDRSFHPIISAFSIQDSAAAREACGEQSTVWGIPSRPGPCCNPEYHFRVIKSPHFLRMKEYSRSHQLTINDLLLAACFAALCPEIPHHEGQHLPVLTSIDLRRSIPRYAAPHVANLSVAFEIWLPVKSPFSFQWLAMDVHRVMAEKKGLFAGIGAAIRLQEVFSMGFFAVREDLLDLQYKSQNEHYPKNPFFSNTGIIPPEYVEFGDVSTMHAFMGPPVDYPPGFGITASTYQDRLTLASGFCGDSVPGTMVERVLSRMENLLITISRE